MVVQPVAMATRYRVILEEAADGDLEVPGRTK